jgi:hypothetical protein
MASFSSAHIVARDVIPAGHSKYALYPARLDVARQYFSGHSRAEAIPTIIRRGWSEMIDSISTVPGPRAYSVFAHSQALGVRCYAVGGGWPVLITWTSGQCSAPTPAFPDGMNYRSSQ